MHICVTSFQIMLLCLSWEKVEFRTHKSFHIPYKNLQLQSICLKSSISSYKSFRHHGGIGMAAIPKINILVTMALNNYRKTYFSQVAGVVVLWAGFRDCLLQSKTRERGNLNDKKFKFLLVIHHFILLIFCCTAHSSIALTVR